MKDQPWWRQAWHALIRDTPAFASSRSDTTRTLARAAFWLGGQLSRIQVRQRVSTIKSWDPLEFESAGRVRQPIPPAVWLLTLSERLDPYHWEHWALDHSGDNESECSRCEVCGGGTCWDHPSPEEVAGDPG